MEEVLHDDEEGGLAFKLLSPLLSRGSAAPRPSSPAAPPARRFSAATGADTSEVASAATVNKGSPRSSPRGSPRAPSRGVEPSSPRLASRPVSEAAADAKESLRAVVGWLWKRFPVAWKRKYFVLKGTHLVFYESEEFASVKGHCGSGFIDMSFMTRAQTKGPVTVEGQTLWTFEIALDSGREWMLAADTPERCILWLKSLTALGNKPTTTTTTAAAMTRSAPELPESLISESLIDQDQENEYFTSHTYEFTPAQRDDSSQLLDLLDTTLAYYDPEDNAAPPVAADENAERRRSVVNLQKRLKAVLAMDDETFYAAAAAEGNSKPQPPVRERSDTSHQVVNALADLDEAIFGDLDESLVEEAVRATIDEHVAVSQGGAHHHHHGASRAEVAARLKSRIVSIRFEKSTPNKSSESASDEDELAPLPDTVPSIHDHHAYRAYMQLRRAHDRKKREGNAGTGWTRAFAAPPREAHMAVVAVPHESGSPPRSNEPPILPTKSPKPLPRPRAGVPAVARGSTTEFLQGPEAANHPAVEPQTHARDPSFVDFIGDATSPRASSTTPPLDGSDDLGGSGRPLLINPLAQSQWIGDDVVSTLVDGLTSRPSSTIVRDSVIEEGEDIPTTTTTNIAPPAVAPVISAPPSKNSDEPRPLAPPRQRPPPPSASPQALGLAAAGAQPQKPVPPPRREPEGIKSPGAERRADVYKSPRKDDPKPSWNVQPSNKLESKGFVPILGRDSRGANVDAKVIGLGRDSRGANKANHVEKKREPDDEEDDEEEDDV